MWTALGKQSHFQKRIAHQEAGVLVSINTKPTAFVNRNHDYSLSMEGVPCSSKHIPWSVKVIRSWSKAWSTWEVVDSSAHRTSYPQKTSRNNIQAKYTGVSSKRFLLVQLAVCVILKKTIAIQGNLGSMQKPTRSCVDMHIGGWKKN